MSRTALIVDDSVSMRQMVAFTLGRVGFEVIEATNGEEGIAQLDHAGGVDLIVTDLNMPVMDGLEFIRRARARPDSKHTPLLMLSTENHESKIRQGKVAGATGWIVKPFSPMRFVQVVSKLLP